MPASVCYDTRRFGTSERSSLMSTPPLAQRRGVSSRTWLILGFVGILIAIIVTSALNQPHRSVASRQSSVALAADHTNAQLVAQGKVVYAARCASCHGANLEGAANWQTPLADGSMPAPPHDANGHTWHHNDQSLFATVKLGGQATSPPDRKNTMPAFGGLLSDTEIWATIAYIKSTWPVELQEQQKNGHQ
jgi:S-disulfanyl-L-cysteine oxidoreductase SoxD